MGESRHGPTPPLTRNSPVRLVWHQRPTAAHPYAHCRRWSSTFIDRSAFRLPVLRIAERVHPVLHLIAKQHHHPAGPTYPFSSANAVLSRKPS